MLGWPTSVAATGLASQREANHLESGPGPGRGGLDNAFCLAYAGTHEMGSTAKPADHLLLGVIDAFMKTSRVFILLTFVFVGCLVLQGAQLTANQAKALAVQLADEKFATIWHVEKTSIFKTNTPSYGMGATLVTTNHFVDDHWVIDLYTSQPDHQFEAHIELAADGSTNQTTVRSHQGLP